YNIRVSWAPLQDLCDALGVRVDPMETPGDALDRAVDQAIARNTAAAEIQRKISFTSGDFRLRLSEPLPLSRRIVWAYAALRTYLHGVRCMNYAWLLFQRPAHEGRLYGAQAYESLGETTIAIA